MEFIASEDFKLTPAIKEAVHERVEQVNKFLKNDENVTVNLSKEGDNIFNVIIQVRSHKHDFVGTAKNEDFYVALNQAKAHVVRQLSDNKDKHLASRHS